jgi:hypothetical protein
MVTPDGKAAGLVEKVAIHPGVETSAKVKE